MSTVNVMVRTLLLGSGTALPVRLAEADREDNDSHVRFQATSGVRDPLLGGGVSGFESWTYLVSVCGNDGETVETNARVIQDYFDALAVNYDADPWIVQSAYTSDVSDDNRPDIIGDKFLYVYSFTLNLALGRKS